MMHHDPLSIAIRFNDCINRRDLGGLVGLMTSNHRFVDSAGNQTTGRDQMREAWKQFFESWPDYRNIFSQALVDGDLVVLVGTSHCADPILDGPSIWTARIEEDMIGEWCVWEDSPEPRKRLGLTIL